MSITARFLPRHHRREPERTAVTFMTVRPGQCKWPTGEPGPDMPMCGGLTLNAPYCDRHRRIAYLKPGSRPPR